MDVALYNSKAAMRPSVPYIRSSSSRRVHGAGGKEPCYCDKKSVYIFISIIVVIIVFGITSGSAIYVYKMLTSHDDTLSIITKMISTMESGIKVVENLFDTAKTTVDEVKIVIKEAVTIGKNVGNNLP